MDSHSESEEPLSAKAWSEKFGENPDKAWWESLSEEERKEMMSSSISRRVSIISRDPESRFKYDLGELFATKMLMTDDEWASINQEVQRVHYAPSAANKQLIESGSAVFIYNAIDQKNKRYQYVDLPTNVNIHKLGEASLYSAGLSQEGLVKQAAEMGLRHYFEVPGTSGIEQELAVLHPLYTANNVNTLPCNIKVITGGQVLHLAFDSGSGNVSGLWIADVMGKDFRGNEVLENTFRVDADKLRGRPVKKGELEAKSDGQTILVTRRIEAEDKDEVILRSPAKIDIKQGYDKLLGFGVLERPYDAHPDQDLFMKTSVAGAFNISFTPISASTVQRVQNMRDPKSLS